MISDEKLHPEERLRKSSEFRNVYNKGRSFSQGLPDKSRFVIYALANDRGCSRIGFSISSKNTRLASRRNRVRRLFREIYRRRKKEMKRPFDLVFVIKSVGKAPIKYKEIEDIFNKICSGANIIP